MAFIIRLSLNLHFSPPICNEFKVKVQKSGEYGFWYRFV